jgi:transposase
LATPAEGNDYGASAPVLRGPTASLAPLRSPHRLASDVVNEGSPGAKYVVAGMDQLNKSHTGEPVMLYLAIDQHRKQLAINLRNEVGDIVLRRQVSTTWEKVRSFFEDLRQLAQSAGGFVTILEVCGFNDWLLKMLKEYGCREIVLIQPETRSKRKTDRRDANQLAELLWLYRGRLLEGKRVHTLRRVRPASPLDAYARQVTSIRCRLVRQRTRTINRVQHILLKHNLQQECPTKGIQTKRAAQWLQTLALPKLDRCEMDGLLMQWKLLDEQLTTVDEKILEALNHHPVGKLLLTLPGAAAYTSLAIACRIGDIELFPRPESLANFWGLTPSSNNSGDNNKRLGSITKQGSGLVRFLLGQLVLHLLRKDREVRQWYREIKRRRGSKIARVAVMRRLATIIWHMIKHSQYYKPFEPRRSVDLNSL